MEAWSLSWDLVELEEAAVMAAREPEEDGGEDGPSTESSGDGGTALPHVEATGSVVDQQVELLTSQLQATRLAGQQPLIEELGDVQDVVEEVGGVQEGSATSGNSSGCQPTSSSSEGSTDSESATD